jgi:microcystin-dependent protein
LGGVWGSVHKKVNRTERIVTWKYRVFHENVANKKFTTLCAKTDGRTRFLNLKGKSVGLAVRYPTRHFINLPLSILMAEPFLSEIRIMSFGFAPKGWALCNGQLLPINQNQALFSLLGTTFGGDGRVNFALPNSQGRAPIHVGSGHTLGERGGEQAHTLSIAEIPTHTHVANATSAPASAGAPSTSRILAQSTGASLYTNPGNLQAMAANSIANVGGSQAHLNMQPFLVLNFCIALQGIFPSPN